MKTRSGIGDLKNENGEWISDDHEKANELRPSLNDSLFAVLLPINFSAGRYM